MESISIRSLEDLRRHRDLLPELINLYTQSFPIEERRRLRDFPVRLSSPGHYPPDIRVFMDTDSPTSAVIGLAVLYHLPSAIYLEYLCTSPRLRSHGLGHTLLSHLLEEHPLMLLEVEPLGSTEWADRRIGFYRRLGFQLLDIPHFQPPYHSQHQGIPLSLMLHGDAEDPLLLQEELLRLVYRLEQTP